MKFSLRVGDSASISPDAARACSSANCVFPGLGSLMGGRPSGYLQMILTLAGFGLTGIFGTKFLIWAVRNWSELYGPQADPLDTLTQLWVAIRWAFLGMVLFGFSWLWALTTSLGIRIKARQRGTPGSAPPIISPPPGI